MRGLLLGIGAVLAVAGVFAIRPAAVANLDERSRDFLTSRVEPGTPDGRVVIVEIDERSLAQLGRWPWHRDLVAKLLRRLFEEGAATVVLDMMFPEVDPGTSSADRGGKPGGASNDRVLAAALAGNSAVLGYYMRFDAVHDGASPCVMPSFPLVVASPAGAGKGSFLQASNVVCSVAEIAKVTSGAGFLNVAPDRDGKLRRVPVLIEYENRYYPSLGLAAVSAFQRSSTAQLTTSASEDPQLAMGGRTVPLEGPSMLRLRFRGGRRTFTHVTVSDVLGGLTPNGRLRGKIAIVGATAPGLQETFPTLRDPLFPGVELQATVIDNLLQADSFVRPQRAVAWELAAALTLGIAAACLLAFAGSFWTALATLAVAAAAWPGCVLLMSRMGVSLSPLPLTAALLSNYAVFGVSRYLRVKRRADEKERELLQAEEHSKEALRNSEFKYRRLVENVNDAIFVDDVEGRLVFANQRFLEWFGLEHKDIGTVRSDQCVAPDWRHLLRDQHDRRVGGESTPSHFEYEGIKSDGTRIWIEALVTNVEQDGRIIGTQSALRDITERKRIEAQYLQAQKMESVGRLAGGVAHDFNNLLTIIISYSEMLLQQLDKTSGNWEAAEQIHLAGERAAELTKKLLAFSRKHVVQNRPTNLNLVVAEVEKLIGRLLEANIDVVTRLDPDLGLVKADPGQLQQVLLNLVVNARDSMAGGGRLTIQTRNFEAMEESSHRHEDVPSGSYACLEVSDTGTGMSEEVQKHVFEPFFTTKEQGKGTGLGLATVYGIVRQCGGTIRFTTGVGLGTTFHIYLPRLLNVPAGQEDAVAEGIPGGGSETILVVEDEDAVRQITKTTLESFGHRVLTAACGPEAIELAGRYPGSIELLVTDMVMPGMSGRALAQSLKSARPQMKVLMVSGYMEAEDPTGNLADGGEEYLAKPFTPGALARKIRELLPRR